MKTIATVLSILSISALTIAGPFKKDPAKLDEKILKAAERLTSMQSNPAKKIPASLLTEARGIIILHKAKAGIGIGVEAGSGVALVRDPRTRQWSAPAFISSAEGSYGFQFGAQESDIILLLMNEAGLKPLQGANFNIGVDVEAVAGPEDKGAAIDSSSIQAPILVYSDAGGLFAGAAFKGGGILPAKKNNEIYYQTDLPQILFERRVQPTGSGQTLIQTIDRFSLQKPRTPQQSTGY